LIPVSSEVGPRSNDTYTKADYIKINDGSWLLFILTKDGHLDLFELSENSNEILNKSSERISQKIQKYQPFKDVKSSVIDFKIGINSVILKMQNNGRKKSAFNNSESVNDTRTIQIGINYNTKKIEYRSKREMSSMIEAILDEQFVN